MNRIGVDLGGTKIAGVAIDGDGREIARRRLPTPRDDYAGTLEAIATIVGDLEGDSEDRAPVGVGTPGAVSPATGRMKNCNSVWLNDRPLLEDLERVLGRSIRIANDADCFAVSEARDGAARGARIVFGVIAGTGTGGGIVVDGAPLRGPNAIAGEWGHNPLPWPTDEERPGAPCYCGRSGCIETFLSGPGISRDHRERTGETATAEEIAREARRGSEEAQRTLDRHSERFARALASIVNVLDPDVVVLGGGVSNLPGLVDSIRRRWTSWIFSDRVDTVLRRAEHGDSSGVRGAAYLW